MPHCLISFGSNLGDRFQRIALAGKAIAENSLIQSFCASRLYENPAVGGPTGQQPFLNGVALLETKSSAREILGLLQSVELQLGRQRAVRWDARSIDLDVVLYGDLQGNSPDLSVPHPRYTARRFVIVPADEVAGQWRDPRFLWSIHELNIHISSTVPSIALVGGEKQLRDQLCHLLTERHGIATFCNPQQTIELPTAVPWVSSFLPPLPTHGSAAALNPWTPRLVAQLQWTTPESRWPATHQLGKALHDWPEYRLEVDSPEWAASELAAAIESLGCPLVPATTDGLWYRNADK